MPGALDIAERGLAEFPDDANLMCLAARAAIALGRFDDAQKHAGLAARKYPGFANALDVLGDLSLAQGKPGEALQSYESALEIDPANSALAVKIDRARAMLSGSDPIVGGRLKRKQMAFADQIRTALEHQRKDESDRAEEIYRAILKADPDHVEASRLLGGIAVKHDRHREALVFLKRAVELAPEYSRALVDLANVQRHLEDFEDAEATARKVIHLDPGKPEAHMLLAGVVGAAGRHEEAIDIYTRVLELDPGKAAAMCGMGHHLKTVGRRDEAVEAYRRCIATQEDHAEAYWSLANLKTFRFEDAEVAAMQALLEKGDLTDESRAQLNNAMAFAFEARRDYDRAFGHFEQCNLIRRRAEYYDPVDTMDTNDRLVEVFTSDFLRQDAAPAVEPTPIFVVGLPRSGSTLIEQILASHSMVEGTHELHDLSKSMQALRQRAGRKTIFPDVLQNLNHEGWRWLGRNYMESSAKHRTGAAYFIDKNPNNFIFTGLIRLAMPNAKIINAKRHPLDSCLGAYKQLFASGQPFSYDLMELGEYYLEYQRVMDHWHSVLPGFVLDVRYEDVVTDLEGQVRRMLDFCGLEFEESCLRFFETERAVKTASSEQVRRPIYSTSVNLWRNYEKHLDTLIEILAPLLQRHDGGRADAR